MTVAPLVIGVFKEPAYWETGAIDKPLP